jgi:hypothetical protein
MRILVCGQPYAPEPMLFLRDLATVSAELWGICPACRRKKAAAQYQLMGSLAWRDACCSTPQGNSCWCMAEGRSRHSRTRHAAMPAN